MRLSARLQNNYTFALQLKDNEKTQPIVVVTGYYYVPVNQ
jgi:hypothetical protein